MLSLILSSYIPSDYSRKKQASFRISVAKGLVNIHVIQALIAGDELLVYTTDDG